MASSIMTNIPRIEIRVTELEERVKFLESRLENKQNNKRPRVKQTLVISVEDAKRLGFRGFKGKR